MMPHYLLWLLVCELLGHGEKRAGRVKRWILSHGMSRIETSYDGGEHVEHTPGKYLSGTMS
jgi:hypothetical protein